MNGHGLFSNLATDAITCPNSLLVTFWLKMPVRGGLLILKDDVVRLDVHVAHPLLMQRSQRTHHLASHSRCICLSERTSRRHSLAQLTSV